jgi:acyl-CoA reductase-like NAD-dependent aldehyde dehydrogenase
VYAETRGLRRGFQVRIRRVTATISGPPPGAPTIEVRNPATGALVDTVQDGGAAGVEAALAAARAAQPAWAALSFEERRGWLRRLVRALRDDATLLDTLVAEAGKPRYEAEAMEMFYTLELTRYYTGRAGQRALRDDLRHPLIFAHKRARVVHHPRGVVGVIGPWNWPLLNNFADCVAPLVAGNAVVLKPSEHTPLTSLRVAALWNEAGLPRDVFQVAVGRGDAGAALARGADMIFFTGSVAVGREVARTCGDRLVPAVLELGGDSAMIVLRDADLPRAAHAAVWSGFANSGQICIRTERVLVEAPVADQFVELCKGEIASLRQGAPAAHASPNGDTAIDVGAITFAPQIDRAERHIADAVAKGAEVVIGGQRRADLRGRFFAPTLIDRATPEMQVMREETFGPVLPVMRVENAEEAMRIANESPPGGLSGSVWSRDPDKAGALARRMQAGSVCVNDVLVNYFCVEAPLGGVKGSGLGLRHGPEALRQFCRVETVVEDHPLLGWLSPLFGRLLTFPYRGVTLRALRRFMKIFY